MGVSCLRWSIFCGMGWIQVLPEFGHFTFFGKKTILGFFLHLGAFNIADVILKRVKNHQICLFFVHKTWRKKDAYAMLIATIWGKKSSKRVSKKNKILILLHVSFLTVLKKYFTLGMKPSFCPRLSTCFDGLRV